MLCIVCSLSPVTPTMLHTLFCVIPAMLCSLSSVITSIKSYGSQPIPCHQPMLHSLSLVTSQALQPALYHTSNALQSVPCLLSHKLNLAACPSGFTACLITLAMLCSLCPVIPVCLSVCPITPAMLAACTLAYQQCCANCALSYQQCFVACALSY